VIHFIMASLLVGLIQLLITLLAVMFASPDTNYFPAVGPLLGFGFGAVVGALAVAVGNVARELRYKEGAMEVVSTSERFAVVVALMIAAVSLAVSLAAGPRSSLRHPENAEVLERHLLLAVATGVAALVGALYRASSVLTAAVKQQRGPETAPLQPPSDSPAAPGTGSASEQVVKPREGPENAQEGRR
jgi:hypothetical protein